MAAADQINTHTSQEAAGAGQEADIEKPRCNLCGADDAVVLYTDSDHRYFVDDRQWPVVMCKRCKLAYLSPRPTPSAIGRYYPSNFYVGRDSVAAQKRYQRQWRYLAPLKPGKLLDIGCANGDWMQFVKDRGWSVTGIEPSENSENPHGLDIRRGRIPEALYDVHDSFDAVTAWAVFEHFHDPLGGFEAVARVLKPGGHLILLVTNIRSPFSRYAYQEDLPRHLYFFSDKTLAAYAEKTGFDLLRVDHTTDIFGGSGRGALRAQAFQALGLGVSTLREFHQLPLAQRFRERPAVAAMDAALAVTERFVLNDTVVRALRVSGIIVGVFRRRG
ncbi:MAG: class I SAM-dependent methyltransferase [Polyangiaceae bacterium]|nr:class I SAM-dependent methyltransferase [Polyangiaceae bacterium]